VNSFQTIGPRDVEDHWPQDRVGLAAADRPSGPGDAWVAWAQFGGERRHRSGRRKGFQQGAHRWCLEPLPASLVLIRARTYWAPLESGRGSGQRRWLIAAPLVLPRAGVVVLFEASQLELRFSAARQLDRGHWPQQGPTTTMVDARRPTISSLTTFGAVGRRRRWRRKSSAPGLLTRGDSNAAAGRQIGSKSWPGTFRDNAQGLRCRWFRPGRSGY